MNREQANALTRRLLERVQSDSSDEAPATMQEPASIFLDEDRWQLERQRLFLDTPQLVGFAGEVPPGSFKTFDVLDVPIVISRDEQGALAAFINACGHRGHRVAEGSATKKRMNCPFHGWSYALDGRLAGRPSASAFDPPTAALDLVRLPVSDRCGLLVVGASPQMSQQRVDHYLDAIAPALSGFNFASAQGLETRRFDVAANWKLVVSLSHESYHFATLHRASLSPLMTAHAVVDEFGPHSRWAFPLRGIEALVDTPEADWPARPPGVINHTFAPGTVLVVPQTDAQLIRVEPGASPGRSVVYYSGVCQHPARAQESRDAYEFGGDIFEREDLPAAQSCQQGLAAGRSAVLIGRNEPIVQAWHRRWNDALL